jgi:hypothetical protein
MGNVAAGVSDWTVANERRRWVAPRSNSASARATGTARFPAVDAGTA